MIPANPSRLLLVEDEADVRELIALHLKREGLEFEEAADGAEGFEKLRSGRFDLIVLDWMLPRLSGLELIKAARHGLSLKTPILMVTARVEPVDIVLGLETGADDYITKPFDIPVLMARIRALLRRSTAAPQEKGDAQPPAPASRRQIPYRDLQIDLDAHEVRLAGREVALTRSEFNLLVTLLENQGKVLTRDRLIDLIRGEDISVVPRAIDTHIFGLRKKLGESADLVETIRGIGYRIRAL